MPNSKVLYQNIFYSYILIKPILFFYYPIISFAISSNFASPSFSEKLQKQLATCIFLALDIFKSLLTVFATESVRVPSTYPKTTFFDVSILTEQEIQIMSRRGFSKVVYLSRFVLLFSCSLLTYILLCTTQQTYSNIFISPSSSESFSDEDENGATRKQQQCNKKIATI